MRTLSNIEALLHPNKISDKLAEQYRKDSDSLARHHQQLVDQGQQWLDAKAKASPVKMLDKFASTFNTVAIDPKIIIFPETQESNRYNEVQHYLRMRLLLVGQIFHMD